MGYSQKSKLAAGLLGIFLGCFGVHNFYLGNTGKAVAQLLLTVIGWIIFIGPAIARHLGTGGRHPDSVLPLRLAMAP